MTGIFIKIFQYFQKHKIILYLLIVLSFSLSAYYGSKLNYEEDISKLLPSTDNTKAEGLVFSELKVKDKIFIQILSKTGVSDTDILLEAGDMLVDSLLAYDAEDGDVGDVMYKIDDDIKQQLLTYAMDNVPVLLDQGLYKEIDLLTSKENVYRQMEANLEKIYSPEGAIFSRIIRYDPINLRSVLLSGIGGKAGGDITSNGDIASTDDGSSSGGGEMDMAKMLGGNYILYGNHFFTSDTTVALVFVSPNFISFDSKAGTRLVKKIERSIKQLETVHPDLEVLFHGPPVQSVFNSRQIKQDLTMTMGLSLVFVCFLIMICFRNKSTLPMLLLPIVYGAFFAFMCMFLMQGMMSLMALGIGVIVLGVALSYCLHVLTHFKYLTDPVRVLQDQVRPVVFGCLTSIGAFMGLMFTQSALLRDFGLFASFAMVGTTIASLLFLPHTFSFVRNRRLEKAFAVLEKINSCPLDRQYWLLGLIVIVFAVSLYRSPGVAFDTNLRNIGYYEPDVTRSMELYAAKTSQGLATSYYAATSESLDSALICNTTVSRICDSLQSAGKISSYTKSSTILLPETEQVKRIAEWKIYWTEERVAELKQNVIKAGEANKFKPAMFDPFFEMISKDYEPSSIYGSSILPEGMMANMIENSQGMYLVYTAVQLEAENLREVNDILAVQPGVIVADPFYYTTNMVELMHEDFNTILWISSLFVLIALLISLRSVLLALIAFLPMGMSWYIVLGVMSMLGLQFNLINIVISSFIFGIGVDYSIFVMEGLLSDVKKYDEKLLMYHKTAIFLSAVVLIISICSLMFAKHPALSSIGVVTLIGMTSTILISYSLQPFLYKLLIKTRYRNVLSRRFKTSENTE
jgi:Predicted exporters of the RND superfamily